MKRVLITGATGGLGQTLVAQFAEAGWAVRATGRSLAAARRLTDLGAEFVPADITADSVCERLCQGADLVVHAAALSATWGRAEDFEAINVQATAALLASARRAGCAGFLYVSSPSIYAAMRDRVGISEQDAPGDPPLNHYARSKLKAERMVLAASGAAFKTCAIRPRALVGPGDRVVLPRLAAVARRGWFPQLRGGQALIELTDLRDAGRAILLAGERIEGLCGEAFNISGGKPITILALARQLGAALGKSVVAVPVPMWIALRLAARAREDGGPEPVLTPYSLATLAYSQTFDLKKAREKLGFEIRHDAVATILQAAGTLT